jgi:6-pyruvoyltetrahydropterin/6-carboxytetrahydropterin synthase
VTLNYAIKVYKQYFNFACSHFMLFDDGSREPLHGHNYRVLVRAEANQLENDMVFDFLNIKPIIRKICDSLDHKLIIPKDNPHLTFFEKKNNIEIHTKDESFFSIPTQDVLMLPILNSSAERFAHYICQQIIEKVKNEYNFTFSLLEVEVEETPGQSAVYVHRGER